MVEYNKPVPVPQPESDRYWAGLRMHELWLRRCLDCDQAYFYPRDICPTCFSRRTDWIRASGKGSLYTYAIVHRAPHPGLADDVPYITALVELDEGVLVPTNIVGVDPEPNNVTIGMPVEVVFEKISEEITLPKFTPA